MLPARSPNLNAYAERWARSVKEECLSRRDRVRLTNHASESNPDSPPRRQVHICMTWPQYRTRSFDELALGRNDPAYATRG